MLVHKILYHNPIRFLWHLQTYGTKSGSLRKTVMSSLYITRLLLTSIDFYISDLELNFSPLSPFVSVLIWGQNFP